MRPKKISDFKLLELATEVIIEDGPELFTLRKVAKHAKVSPATIIKRFQTKENLLNKCISQHVSSIENYEPDISTTLENFLISHSQNHENDNFIQNISLLARDMRDPSLKVIATKYFKGFRKALKKIITNDSRFTEVKDINGFVLQIDSIYQGAIIQGSFLGRNKIQKNIKERLHEYIFLKSNVNLNFQ